MCSDPLSDFILRTWLVKKWQCHWTPSDSWMLFPVDCRRWIMPLVTMLPIKVSYSIIKISNLVASERLMVSTCFNSSHFGHGWSRRKPTEPGGKKNMVLIDFEAGAQDGTSTATLMFWELEFLSKQGPKTCRNKMKQDETNKNRRLADFFSDVPKTSSGCRTFVTAAKRHIAPQGWSAKEVAAGQNLQLTQLYVQFYVLRNTANSTRVSQNLSTGKKWHVACRTITSNKTALNNHIRDPHESIHILFTIFHSFLPNVLQEERHQCSSFLSLTMDHGSSWSDGIAGVEPWVILSQRKVK